MKSRAGLLSISLDRGDLLASAPASRHHLSLVDSDP
jgi:hypothetical protein